LSDESDEGDGSDEGKADITPLFESLPIIETRAAFGREVVLDCGVAGS
jgi:hypothetical protein